MLLQVNPAKRTWIEAARWCIVNDVDYKLYIPKEEIAPFCIDVRGHILHFKKFSGAVKARKKPAKMGCADFSEVEKDINAIYKPYLDFGIDKEFFDTSFLFFDDRALWLANAMKFKLCEKLDSFQDNSKLFAILRDYSAIVRNDDDWVELYYPWNPSGAYLKSISPLQGYDDGNTMVYFEITEERFDNVMWSDANDIVHISSKRSSAQKNTSSRPMSVNKGHWRNLKNGKSIWVEMYLKRKRMEAKYYISDLDIAA